MTGKDFTIPPMSPKSFTMTKDGIFSTSDGCRIAYSLHAAPRAGAPRFVLIHSLALDRSVWEGIVDRLSAFGEVLTYDCRGHGRSGRPASHSDRH